MTKIQEPRFRLTPTSATYGLETSVSRVDIPPIDAELLSQLSVTGFIEVMFDSPAEIYLS